MKQYKKVSQLHVLGFMNYLEKLGFVIVKHSGTEAMFLTSNQIVPVKLRRIVIDDRNRLNSFGQSLYREFVEWTKEIYGAIT